MERIILCGAADMRLVVYLRLFMVIGVPRVAGVGSLD